MAWNVDENEISMCEGDYGIDLPITITGVELTDTDSLKITIRESINAAGDPVLEKSFTEALSLSADDTSKLSVGKYVYSLDWYKNDQFMCNIIPKAPFRVVDKV